MVFLVFVAGLATGFLATNYLEMKPKEDCPQHEQLLNDENIDDPYQTDEGEL